MIQTALYLWIMALGLGATGPGAANRTGAPGVPPPTSAPASQATTQPTAVVPTAIRTDLFLQDLHALTRQPHRLSGTPAGHEAIEYVRQRLHNLGIEPIYVLEMPVWQTTIQRCELTVGNQVIPLLPMRSNLTVPPVTPAEGITGELLYAGRGELKDYGTRSAQGKLVILEYDCEDNWTRAFELGAKAVLFLGSDQATPTQAKWVGLPSNLLRFYVPEESQKKLNLRQVQGPGHLVSQVTWERTLGRNIFALLAGTNPVIDPYRGAELVVLSAPLDSFGEVPQRTPGARNAANAAALLQAAEYLKNNRPRRDVLLAFFDNQARHMQGSRTFYSALNMTDAQNKALQTGNAEELNFVEQILAQLSHNLSDRPENQGALGDRLLDLYRSQAENDRGDVNLKLIQLRLRSKAGEQNLTEEKKALEDELVTWDNTRRALNNGILTGATPAVMEKIRVHLSDQFRERHKELKLALGMDQERQKLRARLRDAWIALHINFNFSDGGQTWGVVLGDATKEITNKPNLQADAPGFYTKVLSAFRKAQNDLKQALDLDPWTLETPQNGLELVATPFISDAAVAGTYGIYNVSLMTMQDSRPRDGHPADNLANLNWRRLARQADQAIRLCRTLADGDALSLKRTFSSLGLNVFPKWDAGKFRTTGNFLGLKVSGSLKEERPATGAVLGLFPSVAGMRVFETAEKVLNFDYLIYEPLDVTGHYPLTSLRKDYFNNFYALGVLFEVNGQVRAISSGMENSFLCKSTASARTELILSHGYVTGYPLMGRSDISQKPFNVLQAFADASFRPEHILNLRLERFAGFYLYDLTTSRNVKLFQVDGPVNLGIREDSPFGRGTPLGDLVYPPTVDAVSARELWSLNETRLKMMRTRGVSNPDLELIHARARQTLDRADSTTNTSGQLALYGQSLARSWQVYEPVRQAMNDLIKAVVFLLLLAIPFAISMERLLICAPNIYGRIGGFIGIFLATFFLLHLLHPGFGLASTPIIVFLAFLIILLSSLVIIIVLRKFQTELKAIQGQAGSLREATLSRTGTFMAAVNMGMSTMRRRPLRTMLTAVTVVMLTFTILCFASLGSNLGVREVYEGPPPDNTTAGLLIHRLDYGPLSSDLLPLLGGKEGRDGLLAGQWWLARYKAGAPKFGIGRPDAGESAYVEAILGVSGQELERWPQYAQAFSGSNLQEKQQALAQGGVYLPPLLAEQLKLKVGDPVLLAGKPAVYAGQIDLNRLQRLKGLDGRSLLPVDFQDPAFVEFQKQQKQQREDTSREIEQVQREFSRLSASSIIVTSAENVRRWGGTLHAANIYPGEDIKDPIGVGKELAEILSQPVWAKGSAGVERLVFTRLTEVSGGLALMVPVILGGMIIFGTMLGSIADREKEISTFSALGLAPAHVGFLFLSEATVYAVVGGMGGQILAQVVALTANAMARAGWIATSTINFSSTNVLFAIGMVMATVLVSAIYPAVRAGRSANPGVARTWRMPAPEGDVLQMIFPFTVSAYDITGVLSFLAEHFRNHVDAGLGVFASTRVAIERTDDDSGNLCLTADLALAPFDLGVTQRFKLTAVPSEIPGVDEVGVKVDRSSGARSDWQRCNRVFIQDLRRQFLLWRTLGHAVIEKYRLQTLQELDEQPPAEPAAAPVGEAGI